MQGSYSCPTPGCPNVFAAADLAGRPAVTCPRCGVTFPLAAPAAPPPPPAYPGYATPAPAYAPPPEPAAPAYASPGGYAAPPAAAPPAPPRRRAGGGADLAMSLLFLAGMLGTVGTVLVVVFYTVYQRSKQMTGGGGVYESDNFAYTFQRPSDRAWRLDSALRAGLDANCVHITRADPTAWFALGARDTKGRPTSDEELLAEAQRRLRDFFQRMEFEVKEDGEVAGRPAKRVVFIGEDREVPVAGEVLAVAHNGFDYWFTFYAPRDTYDAAKPEFEDMKRRFAFAARKGAVDKSAVKAFPGDGYSLQDTEGLWEEYPESTPAKDFDPNADLALRGRHKQDKKDAWKGGQALVMLIPPGGEPLAAASAYVLAAAKKDYPTAKLTEDTLKADGKMGDAGDGKVGAYKLELTDNLSKFVVLGAATLGDKVVVVRCECRADQRAAWEREFARLVGSFRSGAGR